MVFELELKGVFHSPSTALELQARNRLGLQRAYPGIIRPWRNAIPRNKYSTSETPLILRIVSKNQEEVGGARY